MVDNKLFADAETFATPDPGVSEDYKNHYLNTLIGLQAPLKQNLVVLALSTKTYAALNQNNKYPNTDNLKRAFGGQPSGQPKYVSCDMLDKLVQEYMMKATWLEDDPSVGELEVEEFTCEPPEYLDLQMPELRTLNEEFIARILLDFSGAQQPGSVNPTMLSGVKLESIDGAIPEALVMDISSTLLIEDGGAEGDIVAEPDDLVEKSLEGKVYLIFTISDHPIIAAPTDLLDIWKDTGERHYFFDAFENIDFLKDPVRTISALPRQESVLRRLCRINTGDGQSKDSFVNGFKEDYYSTGRGNDGRLYFRGEAGGKYTVLVSLKRYQDRDAVYLHEVQ